MEVQFTEFQQEGACGRVKALGGAERVDLRRLWAHLNSYQVKSRVTPRGNMKAARSVNHRGLPGGGGLWVCMRRPQQLYGPRGMGVRVRALRCQRLSLSELRVLASLLCVRVHTRQSFPFSEA